METEPASADHEPGAAWRDAIEFGVDVTLLEHNLSLTPTERLEQLQQMTLLYELLRPRNEHPADP